MKDVLLLIFTFLFGAIVGIIGYYYFLYYKYLKPKNVAPVRQNESIKSVQTNPVQTISINKIKMQKELEANLYKEELLKKEFQDLSKICEELENIE